MKLLQTDLVLTLVARGGGAAPGVATAVSELAAAGAEVERPPRVLAEDVAYDIRFRGSEAVAAEQRVRDRLEGTDGLDLAIQPVDGRAKKLLVADMESTVIENEMLNELAAHVGAGDRVAEITARAMNGELDFVRALEERVGLLAGLPASVLEQARTSIRLDSGAAALLATLKDDGLETALVSGGFMTFAQPVADDLGFDHCQANRLEVRDGKLTGQLEGPVLDREAKVRALDDCCSRLGLSRSQAVAIGDGANDLSMLAAVGLGVAYHGKPAVATAAPHRIDAGDLATLLYYLGYAAADWSRTQPTSLAAGA